MYLKILFIIKYIGTINIVRPELYNSRDLLSYLGLVSKYEMINQISTWIKKNEKIILTLWVVNQCSFIISWCHLTLLKGLNWHVKCPNDSQLVHIYTWLSI